MKKFISVYLLSLSILLNLSFAGRLDPRLVAAIRATPGIGAAGERQLPVIIKLKKQIDPSSIRAGLAQNRGVPEANIDNGTIFKELERQTATFRINLDVVLQSFERQGFIASPKSFWIVNAVALKASPEILQGIADLPEVEVVALDEPRNFLPNPIRRPAAGDGNVENWGIAHIRADVAHKQNFTGAGVKVYIIDSGIDLDHPAFAPGQILAKESKSFVPNEDLNDGIGHGTHCAGVVASSQFGVAPDAKVVAIKVLDSQGMGTTRAVVEGIEHVVKSGGYLVNMSLGGQAMPGFDDPVDIAVTNSEKGGVFFSIAAGNEGPRAGTIGSPGVVSSALTVAATGRRRNIADFSSRGPTVNGDAKPDVGAPGIKIPSASKDGTIEEMDGTSMAAPHALGLAALLYGKWFSIYNEALRKEGKPRMTALPPPQLIKKIIMETADGPAKVNVYGAGIINCEAALAAPFVTPGAQFRPFRALQNWIRRNFG